jgi:hypothetical protein
MIGRISTVRDFQSIGYTIAPCCSHYFACTHFATLPIDYLADHLGWDFDLYEGRPELRRRLRCSKCGWNWPDVHIATQQDRPRSGGAALTHEEATPFLEALERSLEMRAGWRARGEQVIDGGYRRRR